VPVLKSTIGWKTTSKSLTVKSRTKAETALLGSSAGTGRATGCVVDRGKSRVPELGGLHVTASWIAAGGGFETRAMNQDWERQ